MRSRLWALVLAAACLPFLGWWSYGLFDIDEGFYAAVTAEMNRRGEWVTPFYNGQPWFEKPILLYWLAKPSLALFGEMVGPRLPSVVATVLTIWLLAAYVRRRFGFGPGLWTALVFGGSLLVVAAGRMMLTDPLLVLCFSAAMLSFWESLVGDRRWRLLSAACLGLGILAKGPVAGLLFLLIVGLAYWRLRELRPAFRGQWPAGTAILAAVVAAWYVPAYLANGQVFVDRFLIEQNLGRFTGGDAAHTVGVEGLLIYPLALLLGMLPWSVRAVPALTDAPTDPFERFLRIWFWVVLVFFSISGAKLPHYILPAVPALAMLLALRLGRTEPNLYRVGAAVAWMVGVGAFAHFAFTSYYFGFAAFGTRVPGFHAEVHALARYAQASEPQAEIVVYQMSRREQALGTGKPKIQETSHPSLLLYLDRNVVDTDDLGRILAQPGEVLILTRWNRVRPEDVRRAAAAGRTLGRMATPVRQDMYALWRLSASPAGTGRMP